VNEEFVSPSLGLVKYADIQTIPPTQLVHLYNELRPEGTPPVAEFHGLLDAYARTKRAWHSRFGCPDVRIKVGEEDVAPRVRSKNHKMRPGSKRSKLAQILERGATIEEGMEATGWDRRNVQCNMHVLVHRYGFGLRCEEDGRVFITPFSGEAE